MKGKYTQVEQFRRLPVGAEKDTKSTVHMYIMISYKYREQSNGQAQKG